MDNWKLELKEDLLRKSHPVYADLMERIAGYRTFYNGLDKVPEQAPEHFPGSSLPDTRRSDWPFSTLLCLYDRSGNEYTFSRGGMRHMKRALPWQGHYHTHDYIEILYVAQGSFEQILLGERRKFLSGEFVITDRNLEHADVLSGEEDTAVLFLQLQADYLDRLLSSYDRDDDLLRFFFHALRTQRREQSYLHLCPSPAAGKSRIDVPGLLPVILEHLIAEDYMPMEGSSEITRGYLLRLLAILCRHYDLNLRSSDRESREKALLYELERFIHLHPATVCARDLEEHFHYHRNYFNLLLKKYRTTSYQKYLRDVRLETAASLLKNSALPIREVALRAGYHNSSHFYHLFEQRFGVSPSVYRKTNP